MSNHTVPATAEGMPSSKQRPVLIEAAFANVTSLVSLACDMIIENADTGGGDYRLPMEVGEQITALLLLVRDSSKTVLAETGR